MPIKNILFIDDKPDEIDHCIVKLQPEIEKHQLSDIIEFKKNPIIELDDAIDNYYSPDFKNRAFIFIHASLGDDTNSGYKQYTNGTILEFIKLLTRPCDSQTTIFRFSGSSPNSKPSVNNTNEISISRSTLYGNIVDFCKFYKHLGFSFQEEPAIKEIAIKGLYDGFHPTIRVSFSDYFKGAENFIAEINGPVFLNLLKYLDYSEIEIQEKIKDYSTLNFSNFIKKIPYLF